MWSSGRNDRKGREKFETGLDNGSGIWYYLIS